MRIFKTKKIEFTATVKPWHKALQDMAEAACLIGAGYFAALGAMVPCIACSLGSMVFGITYTPVEVKGEEDDKQV